MSENENKSQTATTNDMVPVNTSIDKDTLRFLKEYLAFFGSDMSIEDLARQMIYEEAQYLHGALKEFLSEPGVERYVSVGSWITKFKILTEVTM